MAKLRDLRGRSAVVTGASSGLGRGLAKALADRGARVALVARREDRLEALAAEIAAGGGSAIALPCDVASPEQITGAADRVHAEFGRIDLLVNAAGYARHILFKDQSPEEAEHMMAVNYFGAERWIRAVLPGMRERREGWIVNLSSFAGRLGQPDEASYAATKFALTGLSESLAMEFAPLGIHVLVVHPVLVRTEMFDEETLSRMPTTTAKAFIEVEDFCETVLAALARGAFEVTVPRRFGLVYLIRLLFPGLMRRQTAAIRLPVLPDFDR